MNTLPSYTSSSARSDSGAGERDGRGTGDGDGVAPTQLHHRGGHVAQGARPVDDFTFWLIIVMLMIMLRRVPDRWMITIIISIIIIAD